jgi:Tfp pilus assembly PilM family ATPase
MNTKKPSYEPEYVAKNGATIKTVSMQVAVTDPNLQNAVREAFALAKSGGRELNLAFSLQSLTQNIPKQSDIRAAHLASPRVGC